MKLFNWLFKKEGKIQPSVLGIGAAVAVAAVGGYLALSPSSDVNPNTVFSTHDEADLVYVTGPDAGGYSGTSGTETFQEQNERESFKITSKALHLMEEDAAKKPVEENELDQQETQTKDKIFEMDGSNKEGLNLDKGEAFDLGGGSGDLASFNKKVAEMKKMIDKQQAAAAAGGADGASGDGEGGEAAGSGNGSGAGAAGVGGGMATANGSFNTDSFGGTSGGGSSSSNSPKNKLKGIKNPKKYELGSSEVKYSGGRTAVLEAMQEYSARGETEDEQVYKMMAENEGGNAVRDYYLAVRRYGGGIAYDKNAVPPPTEYSNPDLIGEDLKNTKSVQAAHTYEDARDQLRQDIQDWIGDINNLFNNWNTKGGERGKAAGKGGIYGTLGGAGAAVGIALAVAGAASAIPIWGWIVAAAAAITAGVIAACGAYYVKRKKMKEERDTRVQDIMDKINDFKKEWEPRVGEHALEYADNAVKIIDELKQDKYWNRDSWKEGNTDLMKNKYNEMVKELWPDAEQKDWVR